MTDLLLVVAHHPAVGHHQSGFASGIESDFGGFPNYPPVGLAEGHFLLLWFLRLSPSHCFLPAPGSGSRWTLPQGSVSLLVPFSWDVYPLYPSPAVPPQRPFPLGHV